MGDGDKQKIRQFVSFISDTSNACHLGELTDVDFTGKQQGSSSAVDRI